MEQLDNNSKINKRRLVIAYCDYFFFWINIVLFLIIALSYQKLFELFNSTVLTLIALVTAIATLLTGKKYFELKQKSFLELFSSPKTWIPNLIFFFVLGYLSLKIFAPPYQQVIVLISHDDFSEFSEPIPINGTAFIYAKRDGTDSLVAEKTVEGDSVEIDFPKPQNVDEMYLKLIFENKYDRFYLERDSFPFASNFNNPETFPTKMRLNGKQYKIILPLHLTEAKFEDMTDMGKLESRRAGDGKEIYLVNGLYHYSLFDKQGIERFTDILEIDNSYPRDEPIKLPKKAATVIIKVPIGSLSIYGKDYLGKMVIKNEQELRLLNNTNYEYVLSAKYYSNHTGIFSTKDADVNGNIVINMPESNRRKATVRFITKLPDGEEVLSDIMINDTFKGKSNNTLLMNFGIYKSIRFRYVDLITNSNEKFIYEKTLVNYEINDDPLIEFDTLTLNAE